MKKILLDNLAYILAALLLMGAGTAAAIQIKRNTQTNKNSAVSSEQKNLYQAFTEEVFDSIQKNYWDKISDEKLATMYQAASDKVLGKHVDLPSANKAGLEKMMTQAMEGLNPAQRNMYTAYLSAITLDNLPPEHRSALYTTQTQQNLNNQIFNVNPNQNLYNDLGVQGNASQGDIQKSYRQKAQNLAKQNTPQAKQELAKINNAYATLAKPENRQRYDNQKIQSTVSSAGLNANTFYIRLSSFSPLSVQEFTVAVNSASTAPATLSTLVFDMRGNAGGFLDIIPQLLGMFLGKDHSAYSFLHQDQYTPFPTTFEKLPALDRFTKVIVLIDGQDRSSTELLAGALQKYKVGVLVGNKTFGWGSVENAQGFPIQNQIDALNQTYSVHLVTNLTVVGENQIIEGKGITPDIDTAAKGWQKAVETYAGPAAVNAVEKILSGKLTF